MSKVAKDGPGVLPVTRKFSLYPSVPYMFHFPYMTQMERVERTGYKIKFKVQTLAIFSSPIFSTHHLIPYYLMIAISCHMSSCFMRMSLHREQALPSMWNEPLPCFSWQTAIHIQALPSWIGTSEFPGWN